MLIMIIPRIVFVSIFVFASSFEMQRSYAQADSPSSEKPDKSAVVEVGAIANSASVQPDRAALRKEAARKVSMWTASKFHERLKQKASENELPIGVRYRGGLCESFRSQGQSLMRTNDLDLLSWSIDLNQEHVFYFELSHRKNKRTVQELDIDGAKVFVDVSPFSISDDFFGEQGEEKRAEQDPKKIPILRGLIKSLLQPIKDANPESEDISVSKPDIDVEALDELIRKGGGGFRPVERIE